MCSDYIVFRATFGIQYIAFYLNIYFFDFKDYLLEHIHTYLYIHGSCIRDVVTLHYTNYEYIHSMTQKYTHERYSLDSVNKKVVSHCIKIKGPLSLNGVCCYKQKRICPFRLWMLDVSKMSWTRRISGCILRKIKYQVKMNGELISKTTRENGT